MNVRNCKKVSGLGVAILAAVGLIYVGSGRSEKKGFSKPCSEIAVSRRMAFPYLPLEDVDDDGIKEMVITVNEAIEAFNRTSLPIYEATRVVYPLINDNDRCYKFLEAYEAPGGYFNRWLRIASDEIVNEYPAYRKSLLNWRKSLPPPF